LEKCAIVIDLHATIHMASYYSLRSQGGELEANNSEPKGGQQRKATMRLAMRYSQHVDSLYQAADHRHRSRQQSMQLAEQL
jgi:hypothetical protein